MSIMSCRCLGLSCSGLMPCPGMLLTFTVLTSAGPGRRPHWPQRNQGPATRRLVATRDNAMQAPALERLGEFLHVPDAPGSRSASARTGSARQQSVDEHAEEAVCLTRIGRSGVGREDQSVTQPQDIA